MTTERVSDERLAELDDAAAQCVGGWFDEEGLRRSGVAAAVVAEDARYILRADPAVVRAIIAELCARRRGRR